MRLFNFFKKEKKDEIDNSNILPLVVRVENVNEAILKVSKNYNISLSSLDFEILDMKTYIKTENDNEFLELDDQSRILLEKEDFLRNEKNEIKQVYEIEIKKYEISDFELIGEVKTNSKFTDARFIISPKSLLIDVDFEKLKKELNKKKVRNGLLIDLFDEKMDESIERFIAKLRVLGSIETNEEIILCKGLEEIPTIQGKIIYHYKKNETTNKKELLYPVKEGEILIEIKKPKPGKNGRNCKGKIIKVEEIKEFELPNINFDKKTIKKMEDENSITFIALKNGYLYKDGDLYTIKDEIWVKQINIKTGDVKGAEDSDVKIDVKESDALKEAIGDNAVVETTTLIVRGNVGNSAFIRCKSLEVMGQTHKKSKIYTKKGEINIHKGYVEADEVKITRLENGIVRANKVKISQAVGGKIYAKKVEIGILGSHLICYALEEIKIKKLKGSENKLIIAPAKVLNETNTEKLQKELEELKRNLSLKVEFYNKRVKVLKENKRSIDELKKIYMENKSKGIMTSPTIIKKIKEYNIYKEKTLELKEKIDELKKDIEELEETINKFQNAVFLAKIISYSPWTPYNRIEFDLIEPPVKLTYDTKGNEGVCGFKLKNFGDAFKIVKIKLKENDDSSS
jgi:hypothetical protein